MAHDATLLFAMLATGMLIGSSITIFARGRIEAALRRRSGGVASAPRPLPQDEDGDTSDDDVEDDGDDGLFHEELKMVLVVNKGLKMSTGKIAAQCCHGCLGAYRRASPAAVKAWARMGQAKITVKAPDEAALREVERKAKAAGIACYLVADAGRTEIPAGSITVIGVGPATAAQLAPITGHFSLL